MSIFRCYALNQNGRIVAAEDIEGINLISVIERAWHFVAAQRLEADRQGLEVWSGSSLLFSTSRIAKNDDHVSSLDRVA